MDCENLFDLQNHGMLLFQRYKIDKMMNADGLVVAEDYRKRGIATRLISVVEKVCKRHGLSVFSAQFTANASNKIADKQGFDCIKRLK